MASSGFQSGGHGQQQQPYAGAQFADYGQQARYSGVPHAAYGVLPYPPAMPPAAQYLPQAGMPPAPDGGYEAEALALAQGIQNNMVLGPGQQPMMQLPSQYYAPQQPPRMPAGYGYGYAPQAPAGTGVPLRPHMGQQQFQQPQQPGMAPMGPMNGRQPNLDMRGPLQNGRGPPRMGPGPRGMGQPPQQPQRGGRKKVQRGLEDNVRRTVYISYIDQNVTEESLATFFADCGTVMDCRICGDPNSAMRFAFIEFMEESGAQEALKMTGCNLGKSQLRVLPSKTAIVPVNKELMPRSEEELERCSRTVYVANIDKKVEREDVRLFFEKLCGRIGKIRLLGDLQHSTRIAFIEFIEADAAMAALNCSGALLGALPLRVSPSKTPVRGDKDDRDSRKQGRGNKGQQQQQQQQGTDAAGASKSPADADGAAIGPEAAGQVSGAEENGPAGGNASGMGGPGREAGDGPAAAAASTELLGDVGPAPEPAVPDDAPQAAAGPVEAADAAPGAS